MMFIVSESDHHLFFQFFSTSFPCFLQGGFYERFWTVTIWKLHIWPSRIYNHCLHGIVDLLLTFKYNLKLLPIYSFVNTLSSLFEFEVSMFDEVGISMLRLVGSAIEIIPHVQFGVILEACTPLLKRWTNYFAVTTAYLINSAHATRRNTLHPSFPLHIHLWESNLSGRPGRNNNTFHLMRYTLLETSRLWNHEQCIYPHTAKYKSVTARKVFYPKNVLTCRRRK